MVWNQSNRLKRCFIGRYPSGKAFRLTPRVDNLNHDIEPDRCGSKLLPHNPERKRAFTSIGELECMHFNSVQVTVAADPTPYQPDVSGQVVSLARFLCAFATYW